MELYKDKQKQSKIIQYVRKPLHIVSHNYDSFSKSAKHYLRKVWGT